MSATRKLVSPLHRFPGTLRPIAAAVIALLGSGAQATDTWVGPASGGYWDVAGNWTSAPANFDAVATGSANTIYRTGTLDVYSLSGSGNLNIQGGTLRVEAAYASFGGSLTMSGGTFSQQVQTSMTLGSLNFRSGTLGEDGRIGAVNVSGMTSFDPAGSITVGTTLNLNGGATWAAGSAGAITLSSANKDYTNTSVSGVMRIAAGTTFADLGNLAAGQSRSLGVVSSGSINNYGTYTRSGLGTTNVQSSMYNAGTVNIDSGAMNFAGTFGVSGAGTWNIASDAALQIGGGGSSFTGTINNGGAFSLGSNTTLNLSAYTGNGSIAVTGGTLTVAATSATMAPGSLSIATGTATIGNTVNAGTLGLSSGGTLGGTGVVTAGVLTFGQGTMTGAGTTTITGVATLDGTVAKSITSGRTLNLNGATTWTAGTTGLVVTGTSIVVVGSGATFADQGTTSAGQTRQLGGSGNTAAFVNQGTYNRTGSGVTQVNAGFSNNGVLNLTGGAMTVAGATSSAGQWNVGSTTTLTFSSGASDVHGGTFNNGGTVAITGGSLAVSGGGTSTGTFSVATGRTLSFGGGSYAFNGGSLSSDGTVALASGATVNFGGGTHTINSGSLSNAGTLTVSAGSLNVASAVTFSGAGTVNVTGGQLNSNAYANLAGGTMNVSGGTATFGNAGTIGTLAISGGTVAAQLVGSGTTLTVGTLSFTGGSMSDPTATGLRTTVTGAATFGAGTETLGNGHQLTLNGATNWLAGNGAVLAIVGGNSGSQAQLVIGSGGTFADLGGGNRTLGGDGFSYVSNAGTYTRTGSGTTTATNSFTNAGTLNINGGTMAFAAGYDTFTGHNSTGTINIGPGATMQDDTRFNVSAGTVNNQGQLKVNAGTTTIAAGVAYSGNGAINVTGGALVSSITGAITTGGSALTGGTASFAGAVNASSLALAGGTLTAAGNFTVATDYTNTGFGSGNGFNKRAGVSGTGLINGTNVTEAITGANVSNGTTGNATLTIGNVRVDTATSYAYQVANTGTGSTLRGAIQTSGTGIGVNDARLTGTGVTAGNFGPLAASTNSGDLAVGFTATAAGALVLSGVNTIHVANNFGNVAEQNLSIVAGAGAAAYNVAAGSASGLSLGNARVNTALSGGITVANTAAAGNYSEDLNASIGGTSGNASATGSLNGLRAGMSNNNTLIASLDNTTAGAKSGSVTIGYTTAGKVAGVSNGLGTLAVGSQTIALSGGVYNVAVGTIAQAPIVIANQRVSGTNTNALIVSNTAASGAFSEALDASFHFVTGSATATGSVSDLVAGGSNGTALRVGVDTATSGQKNGSVTVAYKTDGTGANGNSGLAAISAGSQSIAVYGKVYDVAVGSVASPIVIANQRVGGGNTSALTVSNTAAGGVYSEALNASFGGATGGVITNGGSFSNLAAGSSNASALSVGINTGVAGLISGTATVGYQSDGTGSNGNSGLAAIAAGSQTVNVSGKVFDTAVGSVAPTPVMLANQRVGGTASSALTVSNTATAGAYSEALNASFGAVGSGLVASGSVSNLAAGSSNNNAMSVGVGTSTSGMKSGTVTVGFQTDGTGSNGNSGLAAIAAGSQTVAVSGKVYDIAVGSVSTAPIVVANQRVGGANTSAVTVSNTAAAGAYSEALNASLGGVSSNLIASGSVSNLVAGGSSGNAISVGVRTTTAGLQSGTVTVGYQSDGTGSNGNSGLAAIAAGAQTVSVSGKVYDVAVGSVSSPIVVANQRVGGSNTSAVVVANTAATGGYSEALNASFSGASGGVVGSGSVSNLAAGSSNGSALHVGVDTATAGLKSGTATVAYQSDGTGSNGNSGLAVIGAGSQTVEVSGAVYRLASPTTTPGTITAVGRVGDVAQGTSIGITNSSADVYTEGLTVMRGATAAGFTASGSITNLTAGASSNAIAVKLDTSTAGTFTGIQVLDFVSTGAGTTGAADLGIGSGGVTLNGKVYATAVASVSSAAAAIDFGIVHVGDVVSRGISLTNAAAGALTDVLMGSASGASASFSASGNLGNGLAAGSSSSAFTVGMDTSTSGAHAGTAAFSLASHNADMSDADLADLAVGLTGTVNAYASDAFTFDGGAGTLSHVGSTYYLDYGTVTQGSGARGTTLLAGNSAAGLADLLDGTFEFLDAADFGEMGFTGFANFAAGQYGGPLTFSFDALALGTFTDTIALHGIGHNASGYSNALGDLQLVVRGSVVAAAVGSDSSDVPEPDAWMLIGLGIPLLLVRRGRRSSSSVDPREALTH